MKRLLIILMLGVAPLTAGTLVPEGALAATLSELGDLSSMRSIVSDTLAIVNEGDLAAAATRITDFETAWDDAAGKLRPLSPQKWRYIDVAADAALDALRTTPQDIATITRTLNDLLAAIDDPAGANATAAPVPRADAALESIEVVKISAGHSQWNRQRTDPQ